MARRSIFVSARAINLLRLWRFFTRDNTGGVDSWRLFFRPSPGDPLERAKNRSCEEAEMRETTREQSPETVWNLPELLARVEDDQELARELLAIFKEDFPRLFRPLQEAIGGRELKKVAALGHTLKGMFANLAAARAAAAAARLEEAARAGESGSLEEALETLRGEVAKLLPELDAYLKGVQP